MKLDSVETVPHSMRMFFEDFRIGQTQSTYGRMVTEADIVNFAGMSGDWNPLHTDATLASESNFGEWIAHGVLGIALASGLVARLGILDDMAIAAHEIKEWKFLRPVDLGDTFGVRIEVALLEAVPHLGAG